MSESAVARTALVLMFVGVFAVACKKDPPVLRPTGAALPPQPPPGPTTSTSKPPSPPQPVPEPIRVPPEPLRDETISSASLDDLNRSSPLKPVFFEYDSSELTTEAQAALEENATVLKRNSTWTITIEGHCDERGTAEYNLALGERRAVSARAYLISLGLSADRLRTVSYGKEFPFDPGRDEAAMAKNRRAHFIITAK